MTTTTLTSSTPISSTSTAAQRGRAATAALWIVQIAVAGMFLFAGSLKLAGAPDMVATFAALGVGQWFRYVTGGIEVVAAVALLVPSLAAFGALLLVPTMIGAVITHLFIIGGPSTPAAVLLVASLGILWVRRDELASALSSARA